MPNDAEDLLKDAKSKLAARNYAEAVRICRRVIMSFPKDIDARLLLANALMALAKYSEVRAEMIKLLQDSPQLHVAHRLLGEAYLRDGQLGHAKDALRQTLRLEPKDVIAKELLLEAENDDAFVDQGTVARWFPEEAIATRSMAQHASLKPQEPEHKPFIIEPKRSMNHSQGPSRGHEPLNAEETKIHLSTDLGLGPELEGDSDFGRGLGGAPLPEAPTKMVVVDAKPIKGKVLQSAPPVVSKQLARKSFPPVADHFADDSMELSASDLSAAGPADLKTQSFHEDSPTHINLPPSGGAQEPRQLAARRISEAEIKQKIHASKAERQNVLQPPSLELGYAKPLQPVAAHPLQPTIQQTKAIGAQALGSGGLGQGAGNPLLNRQVHAASPHASTLEMAGFRAPAPGVLPTASPGSTIQSPSVLPPPSVRAGAPGVGLAGASASDYWREKARQDPNDEFAGEATMAKSPFDQKPVGEPTPWVDLTRSRSGHLTTLSTKTKNAGRRLKSFVSQLGQNMAKLAIALSALVLLAVVGTVAYKQLRAASLQRQLDGAVGEALAHGRLTDLKQALSLLEGSKATSQHDLRAQLLGTLWYEHDEPINLKTLETLLATTDNTSVSKKIALGYLNLAKHEPAAAFESVGGIEGEKMLLAEAFRVRSKALLEMDRYADALGSAKVAYEQGKSARHLSWYAWLLSKQDLPSALAMLDASPDGSQGCVKAIKLYAQWAKTEAGASPPSTLKGEVVLLAESLQATAGEKSILGFVDAMLGPGKDVPQALMRLKLPQHEAHYRIAFSELAIERGYSSVAKRWLEFPQFSEFNKSTANLLLVEIALSAQNISEAERLLGLSKSSPKHDYLMGRMYESQQKWSDAITAYRSASSDAAIQMRADERLGAIALAQGKIEEAKAAFSRILEQHPEHVVATIHLSKLLMQAGDVNGAESKLRATLTHHAGDAQLKAALGEVLLAQGKTNEALLEIKEALKALPGNETLLITYASASKEAGEIQAATESYEKVLTSNPTSIPALSGLMQLFISENQTSKAEALLSKAIGTDPPLELAKLRAQILSETGAGESGVAMVLADSERLKDAEIYAHLGTLYLQAELDGEASKAFAQAIRLVPNHAVAWVGKGYLEERAGNLGTAYGNAERAERNATTVLVRARAMALKARVKYQRGSFDDAQKTAEQAVAIDPRCADAHLVLANVIKETRKGNITTELRLAVAGLSPLAEAYALLAEKLGSGKEACAAATRYLRAAPNGYDASVARRINGRCH